ncbi:hypothetical protein KQI36_01120 [Clostridium senegalense]|uniref:hypothetical protein n=1 Tax=Clostridium senegalense TaxID=1465809 RepID=UPI001C102642|nr:hypothetical protein [Clostridium senegalense]MBU5225264.1 hypothetical protein [Clostridium senegalense]
MGFLSKLFGKDKTEGLKYDREFIIDYLNIDYNTTLKDVKVLLPSNSNQIIINNNSMYFDSSYIEEVGYSKDGLYRKIFTRKFAFWITPSAYKHFLNIIKDREKQYKKEKEEDLIKLKQVYEEELEYDSIDNDIYICCIVNKSENDLGNINCGGNRKKFLEIEECISNICSKNNGRYYKTQAENAKFAIIFSCNSRTAQNVKSLREKGYKVTSFENALKFLKLTELWDINKMNDEIKRINEEIRLL